jgi:hypothetical protein
MKKILIFVIGIYTILYVILYTIGFVYEIPDNTLFIDIMKVGFVLWVSLLLITGFMWIWSELTSNN